MFKKFVMAILLAVSVTVPAMAATIDTNGMSDAQIAELKAHAAKVIADSAVQAAKPESAVSAAQTVSLAATFGTQAAIAAEGFAKALGIAARELGVTVNDFLHTDAGKLTAALIVWKVAGAGLIKALYGVLFVTAGLSISRLLYMRLFTKGYEKVEYERFFGMFKGTKLIRIPLTIGELQTDGQWLALWMVILSTVLTIAFGAAFFA